MNCKGCGWCCENLTSLKIDFQEFERLCNEIPHFKDAFTSIIEEKKTFTLNLESKGCPFYNKDQKKCSIYEKRPFPCRIYPIHLYPYKDTTIIRFKVLKDLVLEKPNEKTVEDELQSRKYNGSDYYYPETIDLHLCNRYYTIKRNDIIKLVKEIFDYIKKKSNNNIYGFSNQLTIEEPNPIYYLLNHFYIYRNNDHFFPFLAYLREYYKVFPKEHFSRPYLFSLSSDESPSSAFLLNIYMIFWAIKSNTFFVNYQQYESLAKIVSMICSDDKINQINTFGGINGINIPPINHKQSDRENHFFKYNDLIPSKAAQWRNNVKNRMKDRGITTQVDFESTENLEEDSPMEIEVELNDETITPSIISSSNNETVTQTIIEDSIHMNQNIPQISSSNSPIIQSLKTNLPPISATLPSKATIPSVIQQTEQSLINQLDQTNTQLKKVRSIKRNFEPPKLPKKLPTNSVEPSKIEIAKRKTEAINADSRILQAKQDQLPEINSASKELIQKINNSCQYSYAKRTEPANHIISVNKPSRSQKLSQYIRKIAGGICEMCDQLSFLTENDDFALQAYHIIPLANDGVDEFYNVAALCPNCMAKLEYGKQKIQWRQFLQHKIIEKRFGQSVPDFTNL